MGVVNRKQLEKNTPYGGKFSEKNTPYGQVFCALSDTIGRKDVVHPLRCAFDTTPVRRIEDVRTS